MSQWIYKARARARAEDGISLVEMLVSILILGVALSALANVLVTALRTTNQNETQVRATSRAQTTIEALQSVDWDNAVLYADELLDAKNTEPRWNRSGLVTTDDGDPKTPGPFPDDPSTWLFEGNPFVVLDGPGTDPRENEVLRPVDTETEAGVTFGIDRYVTWVDRDGNGVVETKRFTAIVQWEDRFGAIRDLRFEADRVPSQTEAASTVDGLRVLQFIVSPEPVDLTDASIPDTSGGTIDVKVRTNRPTKNAALTVEYLEFTGDVNETGDAIVVKRLAKFDTTSSSPKLTGDLEATVPTATGSATGPTRWTVTLPRETYFTGFSDFTFTVDDADITRDSVTDVQSVEMRNGECQEPPNLDELTTCQGGPIGPAPDPVNIINFGVPTNICVNNGNNQNRNDIVISASIQGFDVDPTTDQPDGNVFVTYTYRTSKQADQTTSSGEEGLVYLDYDGINTRWKLTIPAGSRVWIPGDPIEFILVAERITDDGNATREELRYAVICS